MIKINTANGLLAKLVDIERQPVGYWGQRILAQMRYGLEMTRDQDMNKRQPILDAARLVLERFERDGAITRETCRHAEKTLGPLSALAKQYKVICASHAHIDMNWMWGWPETAAITLDTFRTMLKLMEECPEFTFSQSQASVYKIVEEYDPEMLSSIKSRVKEGRWEVAASTWVEADKNLPSGESMARHLLYAKEYLSRLLDIPIEDLSLDFEPDTFGHSANVPEILNKGGVKYYYHCRGYNDKYPEYHLYRWVSPSGASVLVYREPFWYNAEIEPSIAYYVPEFCRKCGLDTMLRVYGVGDHGGGPTRRDIERIIDMNTWPVFPQIRFGTFREFFTYAESQALNVPEVKDELNFVFTGCYSSQSRIKRAGRKAETGLFDAELFSTIAALSTNAQYPRQAYREAWENVLFNQFHDIITGSCVRDTREYAMGLYQKTMATVQSQKQKALYGISGSIDTGSAWVGCDSAGTVSEGAGAGFGVEGFRVSQVSRGRGKTRLYHAFNPSGSERHEPVEIVVWGWPGEIRRMEFRGPGNEVLPHQIIEQGSHYWDHTYIRVLVQVSVPPFGYTTVVLTERDERIDVIDFPGYRRTETPDEFILENSNIRVRLNPKNGTLASLVDKSTGTEYVDKTRAAGVFRYILEDDSKRMTSWLVGRHIQVDDLTRNVKMRYAHRGPLYQAVIYTIEFGNSSSLTAEVGLRAGSPVLEYSVECDWHEVGRPGKSVPQLAFALPVPFTCRKFKYDVPFGVVERPPLDLDVPANSWALAAGDDAFKKGLILVTDSKHGFRGTDRELSLTLLRSSYDPDPYPEIGVHKMRFAFGPVDCASNRDLIGLAFNYNHPIEVISVAPNAQRSSAAPARGQEGQTVAPAVQASLPAKHSFGRVVQGSVAISTVKMAERGPGMIIRLYETEGSDTDVVISLAGPIKRAFFTDVNELPVTGAIEAEGNRVSFKVKAASVQTVYIEFAG